MRFHSDRCQAFGGEDFPQRRLRAVITLAAVWLLGSCVSRADDVVYRKSTDKRLGGTVSQISKTELTIKPRAGETVTVPVNDIAAIDWDDAPAEFKLARSDESAGRFDSARQRLMKCLDEVKSSKDGLRTDVEYLLARATARGALADPSGRDEAVAKLTAFLKSHADSFRYYEAQQLLGQVQLARQDYAQARAAFEALGQAPWNEAQLSSQINLGRVLMAENRLDEAAQSFDAAMEKAIAAEDAVGRYQAMLGKARSLIAQNRPADALAILTEVLEKAPADDSALQAEAYLLEGNCLQSLNKLKEAVLAYLHVDVLFSRETAYHAEALYHLSKIWKAVQHPDRALECQAKLEGLYPESEWTKRLEPGLSE
ncbi:MAG: tetratricopeptide repeat protein [Planctomycetaceae bacterium]